jgi:hypothetical protein
MWRQLLEMPLINADRMMLSILPEPGEDRHLVPWAARLRDRDIGWMRVAQQGVQAFAGHAMAERVPIAMETVFSYWEEQADGRIASKIDLKFAGGWLFCPVGFWRVAQRVCVRCPR